MNKSLGLIETEGLAAGVEAADAAVKSANVELIGYELTKGGGWTTVKIQGDVGAVKAAVDAAKMAAAKVNRVVSTRVIPRPSAGLDVLVHNPDTVGDSAKKPDTPKPPTPPDHPKKVKEDTQPQEPEASDKVPTESSIENALEVSEEVSKEASKEASIKNAKEISIEVSIENTMEGSTENPQENTVSDKVSKDNTEENPNGVSVEEVTEPDENAKSAIEVSGEVPKEDPGTAPPETDKAGEEGVDANKQKPVPKPARRTAAAKGRKGGRRSSKHEATE